LGEEIAEQTFNLSTFHVTGKDSLAVPLRSPSSKAGEFKFEKHGFKGKIKSQDKKIVP